MANPQTSNHHNNNQDQRHHSLRHVDVSLLLPLEHNADLNLSTKFGIEMDTIGALRTRVPIEATVDG
jgi:hypothetical protein